MAFSNIFRQGRQTLGRAVQAATQALEPSPMNTPPEMAAPAIAPAEGAQAAPAAPAPRGFTLPDLGPGPDANAPEYQGEEGQKRYQSDLADYKHKQDIHQAYADLDKMFTETNPGRDFEKEYREQLAEQQAHEAQRPQGSNVSRALLALSDFNPAAGGNLQQYNAAVGSAQERSDKAFSQRMTLKAKMHEAAAAEAEKAGNWKKALAENEKLALLKADEQALQHGREMQKVEAQQKGATERANIRRESMENSAKIRSNAIGAAHGLSGGFLATFEKEAAKAVAKLLGPRDLTKEYSPADLDSITTYLEHLAEMMHDQQFGDGSSADYLRTHPKARRQPKPTEKEKF